MCLCNSPMVLSSFVLFVFWSLFAISFQSAVVGLEDSPHCCFGHQCSSFPICLLDFHEATWSLLFPFKPFDTSRLLSHLVFHLSSHWKDSFWSLDKDFDLLAKTSVLHLFSSSIISMTSSICPPCHTC